MKRIRRNSVIAVFTVFFVAIFIAGYGLTTATASKDTGLRMIPESFSALAENARPGVVNIRTVKTVNGGGPVFRHFYGTPFGRQDPFEEFFGPFAGKRPFREYKQRSLGSGFIIDRDGYIVTNNHVIEHADQITVKLADGTEFEASVVGRDPKTDLALIKIEPTGQLKPLKMGDSDALKIGGWVVAIGSPFGLEQTVTAGIVSAKGRVIGAGPYDDFIQTDASINPGNSGGPLLNMNGEVVGINTAIIASGQGIGFAIPVNLAKGIIAQLKDQGTVTRGWLGVGIQDVTPELAEYYGIDRKKGVLVTQVYPGEPADKGGIRSGDVIVAVDGKAVASSHDLATIIANLPVGKRTAIEIIRKGRKKTVVVKLTKRDDDALVGQGESESSGELGLELMPFTPEAAHRFGFNEDESGVLVATVRADSKAMRAGVRAGDLIKEVNRNPVKTLGDFRAQVAKVKKGESIQLLIRRANAGFVAIKLTR